MEKWGVSMVEKTKEVSSLAARETEARQSSRMTDRKVDFMYILVWEVPGMPA
jgi:hypothetical protein